MNVKLLREVKRYILAEPLRFNMRDWGKGSAHAPCGSVACIAGNACIVGEKGLGFKIPTKVRKGQRVIDWQGWYNSEFIGEFIGPEECASELLGLTTAQADRLFLIESLHGFVGWPERFEKAYLAAKTPPERAKVAAERIEHFIKTKGKE